MSKFSKMFDIDERYPDDKKRYDSYDEINESYKEKKFEEYIVVVETLREFGFEGNAEMYYAQKFNPAKSYGFLSTFRERCLIAENFKCFDYYVEHPALFGYSSKRLYASHCLYNKLVEEIDYQESFVTFTGYTSAEKKAKVGYTNEEMLKMFPLTDEKIKLMERIHKAKLHAKEKSGGVSTSK